MQMNKAILRNREIVIFDQKNNFAAARMSFFFQPAGSKTFFFTLAPDPTVKEPGNCVLYYLEDGPDRALVREELMHIPEDTQVPREWESKWK